VKPITVESLSTVVFVKTTTPVLFLFDKAIAACAIPFQKGGLMAEHASSTARETCNFQWS